MNGKWHVSGGQILAHTLTQTLILGSSFIIPRYCTLNSVIFVDQCVRPLEWAKGKKCDSNFFISLLNRKWKQTNKLTVPLGVCVHGAYFAHLNHAVSCFVVSLRFQSGECVPFQRKRKGKEKCLLRKMLPTKSRTASRIEKGQTISMPTSLSAKFSLFFFVGGEGGRASEK